MSHQPRMTGTKICQGPSHDGPVELPVIHFASDGDMIGGLRGNCRACQSLYDSARFSRSKAKMRPVRHDLRNWGSW